MTLPPTYIIRILDVENVDINYNFPHIDYNYWRVILNLSPPTLLLQQKGSERVRGQVVGEAVGRGQAA